MDSFLLLSALHTKAEEQEQPLPCLYLTVIVNAFIVSSRQQAHDCADL